MNNLQAIASIMDDHIIVLNRDNKEASFTTKNNSPSWVTDIVRLCHDEALPNDVAYNAINSVLQCLINDDDPNETIGESIPVYTNELNKMVSSPYAHYIDESMSEGEHDNHFNLLVSAHYSFYQVILSTLTDELTQLLEDADYDVNDNASDKDAGLDAHTSHCDNDHVDLIAEGVPMFYYLCFICECVHRFTMDLENKITN